jgi:hypothetical protein
MRKILTAAAVALTMAGSLAATTTPVQAQARHGGGFRGGGGGFRGGGFRRGRGWRGGGWGWGVGAGLAGFALGSALASPYYYGPGYYDYYGCASRVWDPYWGRWVIRYYC